MASHSLSSIEIEMDVHQLLRLPLRNAFEAYRTDDVLIVWTLIQEQDAYVVNVFAPLGHVFWSFGPVRVFEFAQRDFVWSLGIEQLGDSIEKLIRRCHHPGVGTAAYCLLGLFTQQFGHRFEVGEPLEEVYRRCRRHFSAVIPTSARDRLKNHLQEQIRMNGETPLLSCDEREFFVSWGQDDDHPWHEHLCRPLVTMPSKVRRRILDDLRAMGDDLVSQFAAMAMPARFYYPGLISTMLSRLPDPESYDECLSILRMRARIHARIATLSALDQHCRELINPLFISPLRPEHVAELFAILSPRLDAQPFVRDPVIDTI